LTFHAWQKVAVPQISNADLHWMADPCCITQQQVTNKHSS